MTEGQKTTTANSGLAKGGVSCSADSFVVNQSLVLRINICGENPRTSPILFPLYAILGRHRKGNETDR